MRFKDGIPGQAEMLSVSRRSVTASMAKLDLTPWRTGTIGFVGVGGSLNTALVGALSARKRGLRAVALSPTELLDPGIDAADAYIVLSGSGRSAETIEAMRLRPGIPALGICRVADNPLAPFLTAVIETEIHFASSPCAPAYSSVIQALGLLIDAITQTSSADWDKLPAAVAAAIGKHDAEIATATAALSEVAMIDFVAQGASFGTACQGALIAREAARKPAAAFDLYNYLHGYLESLDFASGLVVIGGAREAQLARDAAKYGASTLLVTSTPGISSDDNLTVLPCPSFGDELADALLAMLPIQKLVGGLTDVAQLADAQFRYRQPDTKVV